MCLNEHGKKTLMNKHYILTLVIFIAGFTTYGQSDTIVDGVEYNLITRHDNGQIKELGNYRINKKSKAKQGHWIIYDSDGKLIEKGNYEKDKKDGNWTERGNDNLCCWTGKYKKGKKDGKWFDGSNRFIMYKNGKDKGLQIVEWKR
jgi:antitoxin component YwqK of YwqJK toxin-antitoxin module